MNKGYLVGIGVFLSIIIAGLFLLKKPEVEINIQPTPQNNKETTSNAGSNSDFKEIAITEAEYAFAPSSVELKKGDKVRLTFKNAGGLPHNFIIDDLNLETGMTRVGASETLEFTADKVGEFIYYCGIGNHREEGMEGKLIITE